MILSPAWFNHWLMILAWLAYLPYVAWCLMRYAQPNLQRLMAAALLMTFLWLMTVSVEAGQLAGMSYHLLGLNLATLILGKPHAFLLASVWVLTQGIINHHVDFLWVFPLNAWLVAFPATALNALARQWSLAKLPHNVFVYIFINGFVSGAIGMIITGALVVACLQSIHVFSSSVAWSAAFPVFFLLAWGEAFLSGIVVATCVAFKPNLLFTFDDAVYLTKHNQIWR